MHDIIFSAVPYSNLDHIYPAPAILKGVVTKHGYSAKTIDFGGILFELCDFDTTLFYEVQQYFLSVEHNTDHQKIVDKFFDGVLKFYQDNPSDYIGLSVLSIYSHKCILKVCQYLKNKKHNSKIIIGGRGAAVPPFSILNNEFNLLPRERILKFGDFLKFRNLADIVIYGDGEDQILNVLQENIDNSLISEKSDQFYYPVSDYSDYNFNHYVFPDGKVYMPITGSKGCVRDCDFCDIKTHFGRYRYRSGKDVANEMIEVSKKYKCRNFRFTDSLVNGGLKPFREFLEHLSKYNHLNKEQSISWNGSYICRPPEEVPVDIYKLISESGGEGLTIGAESGSNRVLLAMNKKTTVEALYTELEQFRKHKITCLLLTFVGHWSEDYIDFNEHCHMLVKLLPYVRSGTISAISLGDPFIIVNDVTPQIRNIIRSNSNSENLWHCLTNPNNTIKERIYRRLIVGEICKKLQIPVINNSSVYINLADFVNSQHETINEFYKQLEIQSSLVSQKNYNKFDKFFKKIINKENKLLHLELDLISSSCNGNPKLEIKINDDILWSGVLKDEKTYLNLYYKNKNNNDIKLSISMFDKKKTDTVVKDNIIVLDKFIKINQIKINNFDIGNDYDFFNNFFTYYEHDLSTVHDKPSLGFWKNATLETNITESVTTWYNNGSLKNKLAADAFKNFAIDDNNHKNLLLTSLHKIKT